MPSPQRLIHISLLLLIAAFASLPLMATAKGSPKKPPVSIGLGEVVEPDAPVRQAPADKAARPQEREAGTSRGRGHINNRYREGIDVSHYQNTIDWEAVAQSAQVSYVYIKATEGCDLQDDCYTQNLRGAHRAGLSVGSYHFYRPTVSPQAQLENLTRVVKAKEQDLVPIVDIERAGNNEARFIEELRTFIKLVEKHYGKKPLLYTYQNFYNKHFQGIFKDYPWMIAKYKDDEPQLSDGKDYIIWQYTQTGRIPGIRGNVDRSCIVGSFTLDALRL